MATEKKKVTTTFYVSGRDLAPSEKCPPQAKLILDIVKAGGGKIEREALLALLKRPPNPAAPIEGGLTTTQTAERILAFYRPKYKQNGTLSEVKEVSEIEVEVPDKPAPPTPAEGAPAEGSAPVQEHKTKKGAARAA